MPSRSVFSSGGRRRITSARSSRETLALADQIRSAAARFIVLGRVGCARRLDRGRGQHVGPDLEQELAHAFLHRHFVEHLAQLDRVLDRQRLALLDLLRQRHALAAWPRSRSEVVLEEFLELGEHGLEDAPAGVGVGLDDLDDALDLLLEQRRRRRGRSSRSPSRRRPCGRSGGAPDGRRWRRSRARRRRRAAPASAGARTRRAPSPGCALRSGCSGTAARRSRSSPARPASRPPASAPACAGAAPRAAPAC